MGETIVLKLGGSVITEKDRPETLDGVQLDAVADAVAGAITTGRVDRLALVHGGGSFGHHQAEQHGVTTTAGSRDAGAVVDIHGAMTTLNRFVLTRLHSREVPALPVHPLSAGSRTADGELSLPTTQVGTMLDEGFVPVLHGDGVVHAGEGVTVLSGDEIVTRLARDLDAGRVGLCSAVPGVLDDDGKVIPNIRSFEAVADVLGVSDTTDVTGGMAGKVRTLLEVDVPAHVFGPESLEAFLDGAAPGTRIHRDE